MEINTFLYFFCLQNEEDEVSRVCSFLFSNLYMNELFSGDFNCAYILSLQLVLIE